MSSSQMDDKLEEDRRRWIAEEVGLTLEELEELDFDPVVEPITAGDVETGYAVTFSEDADPELLAKVRGLDGNRTVRIGLPPEEPGPDDLG